LGQCSFVGLVYDGKGIILKIEKHKQRKQSDDNSHKQCYLKKKAIKKQAGFSE
jgi:hypothetical protein